jgi:L-aminopeptidase/D-esterase-like protein
VVHVFGRSFWIAVSSSNYFSIPCLGLLVVLLGCSPICGLADEMSVKPRARDLGIPFDGTPGPLNAITDLDGVEVGHATIIKGDGKLSIGEGPVRTGVTAIFPLGKGGRNGVAAGRFVLNGAGQMTASDVIDEFGGFFGPIVLTGSLSVGSVTTSVIKWSRDTIVDDYLAMIVRAVPVVAETWDGALSDALGMHVRDEHVHQALNDAKSGPVAEGNVGGGTAMRAYEFKAGIGTSSRHLSATQGGYTVGVLVQANHGQRNQLRIAGVSVGTEITELMPEYPVHNDDLLSNARSNSIIIVIGTDAPLLPSQLERIAKRASLGLARTGSVASNGSGDLFIAFSTSNEIQLRPASLETFSFVPNAFIDPLFEATVQATEEAIINAIIAAETMKGIDGRIIYAIPHDRLQSILKKYNRLIEVVNR